MHAGRARHVLNELGHRVLVDHGAWRDRQVASDREGVLVAHLHAAAQRVDFQVVQPRGQAGAARLRGDAQHFRVGGGEVGGRERVEILAQREGQAPVNRSGQLRRVHQLLQPARIEQVGIPQQTEEGQLVPLRRGEAAVGGRAAAAGGRAARRCGPTMPGTPGSSAAESPRRARGERRASAADPARPRRSGEGSWAINCAAWRWAARTSSAAGSGLSIGVVGPGSCMTGRGSRSVREPQCAVAD